MPQQIFYPQSSANLIGTNATYNTCHDLTSATYKDWYWSALYIFSFYSNVTWPSNYAIARNFLVFDTSKLINLSLITSAKLYVYMAGLADSSGTDTGNNKMCLVKGNPSDPSNIVVGDFDLCGDAIDNPTEGASRVTMPTSTSIGWYHFDLNATGISWLNRTGLTVLGIRCDMDCDDVSPIDGSLETLFDVNNQRVVTSKPYLLIDYEIGSQPMPTFFRTTI